MKNSELLTTFDPYRSLSCEGRRYILESMQRFEYQAGDLMVPEYAWIDHVGFLASGRAEVCMGLRSGSPIVAYSLYPGEFYGDLACMTDRKSLVSVVCRETSIVYRQPYDIFLDSLESHSDLKSYFLKSAFHKLWHIFQIVRSGNGGGSINSLPDAQIPRPVKKSLQFIENHYYQPITVAQAAHVAGMSKSAFSRRFKQALGVSFKTYLNQLRISKAKHFIGAQGMNVTEACFAAGFNDTAYFSRIFRKIEGKSPSYLKNGRK